MKSLSIVGFGQFGRLAARTLRANFEVLVTDAAPAAAMAAVPVVAMREVFAALSPDLRPGALVIDVGSVKMLPVQWMTETLPAHVDIVATHPLFGPQSAKDSLEGLRFVVCPVRGERHTGVAAYGRALGLTVTVTTPEEHDREMAYVQALTHLIGRSLVNLGIPDEQLKTPSYQHLLELCALIGADTFELFTAIQTQNPFAAEVAQAFVGEARSLLDQVRVSRS